jgi:hypothetical protein
MMKKNILLVTVLVLSACANKGPKFVWDHNSSNKNFHADKLVCLKMSKSFYSHGPTNNSTSYIPYILNSGSDAADAVAFKQGMDMTNGLIAKYERQKEEKSIFNDCMKAKGWYLKKEKMPLAKLKSNSN